ncbi:GNAT family N-acetyltransferase [Pelagibius marinus]|uniref:GNAT family N-acetyltransferase n=1 Tax=Pelagibius marinus TaxID=2762760 RepID=UPI00187263C7|nr:GNAT family N-acetyltransferase [Pelagibius marinus]
MPLDDFTIRPGKPEDAEFLLPLINRAGEDIPERIWAQMAGPGESSWEVGRARILSEDSGISYRHSWIAEAEGRPAGCLITRALPDPSPPLDPDLPPLFVPLQELENEAPGTGYVYVLSTLREMRGRGIGTRLLGFAERYRGPRGMSLIVADNNTGAKALYERCGYREAARRHMVKDGWDSPGSEWILMLKP